MKAIAMQSFGQRSAQDARITNTPTKQADTLMMLSVSYLTTFTCSHARFVLVLPLALSRMWLMWVAARAMPLRQYMS